MNPYEPPRFVPGQPGYDPARLASGVTGGLKALAIVQIVFGFLGLLSSPISYLTKQLAKDDVSRRIQAVTWEGGMGVYMVCALAVGTVLSACLVAAGFGLLKRRPWARGLSLAYAVATIAMGIVGQVVMALVLLPELARIAKDYANNPVAQAAVLGGRIGGLAGGLFGMMLPVTILIVLTRPSVKAQLAATP